MPCEKLKICFSFCSIVETQELITLNILGIIIYTDVYGVCVCLISLHDTQ